jgi:hypothetical protein
VGGVTLGAHDSYASWTSQRRGHTVAANNPDEVRCRIEDPSGGAVNRTGAVCSRRWRACYRCQLTAFRAAGAHVELVGALAVVSEDGGEAGRVQDVQGGCDADGEVGAGVRMAAKCPPERVLAGVWRDGAVCTRRCGSSGRQLDSCRVQWLADVVRAATPDDGCPRAARRRHRHLGVLRSCCSAITADAVRCRGPR